MASVEERQAAMATYLKEFHKAVKTTLDVVVSGAIMRYDEDMEAQCGVPANKVAAELDYFHRAMVNHAENLLSETALYNYIQ